MHLLHSALLSLCITQACHASALQPQLQSRHLATIAKRFNSSDQCLSPTDNQTLISGISTCVQPNPEPSLQACVDSNSSIILTSACYTTLNINDWLLRWSANNTCRDQEAFGTCFYRLHGLSLDPCLNVTVSPTIYNIACPSPSIQSKKNFTIEEFYVLRNINAITSFFNSWGTFMIPATPITGSLKPQQGLTFNKTLIALASLGELTMQPFDPKGVAEPSYLDEATKDQLVAWVVQKAISAIPDLGKILCSNNFSTSDSVKASDISTTVPSLLLDGTQRIRSSLDKVLSNVTTFAAFPSLQSSTFPGPRFGGNVDDFAKTLTDYVNSSGKQKTQIESSMYAGSLCANIKS